jgi:hypothetical protein
MPQSRPVERLANAIDDAERFEDQVNLPEGGRLRRVRVIRGYLWTRTLYAGAKGAMSVMGQIRSYRP